LIERVDNTHDGYCSGDECKPQSQEHELHRIEITLSELDGYDLPKEEEDVPEESDLFQFFKERYNSWRYEPDFYGSGYCENTIDAYKKHTQNVFVRQVTFVCISK
jgi:hypothetical protein